MFARNFKENNYMENNKKINLSIILSIVALVLFIGVVICWIISTKGFAVVVPETFNSSCLGIISLAATFIVGYQIISTMDIKQTMKENEKKLEQEKINLENDYNKFKSVLKNEIECLKNTNEKLMKSLEFEKKQRELIYQETKVAMYHGKTIQNSSLALMEQIDAIKLILDINKTNELKDNIKLLFLLINDIHQNDFSVIQSDRSSKIVGLKSRGIFKLNEYEKEIKIMLRKLPQENELLTNVLILVEKAFDKKMEFLKNGSVGNNDSLEKEINNIYSEVDAMQLQHTT